MAVKKHRQVQEKTLGNRLRELREFEGFNEDED